MIPTTIDLSKFSLLVFCFSTVLGCKGEEPKPDIFPQEEAKTENRQKTAIDPFQPNIDRLILGEKVPLEQLVKELEHRTWKEIQPLILASIKQKSQEPNWTRVAQKKALSGYAEVRLIFSKRRRQQSLAELRNAIQTALKEEQAKKHQ